MEIEGEDLIAIIQEENLDVDENLEKLLEPKVGMWFDSEYEALKYYGEYGKRYGFGAKFKSSKRNFDGVKDWVAIGCHKARKPKSNAKNRLKPPPTKRVDCRAGLNISLKCNKWMVNSLNLDHNHEMDLNAARFLKHNRTIPLHDQYRIESDRALGIKTNKSISRCQNDAGGSENLTWGEKEARNHLDKIRRHNLKGGDAHAMIQYFSKQQRENSNFFWAIDLDTENRLTKVFWADARSREAYKYFGDVVTFDTTYLVNRYEMPFAPFVGVNHHGHSILFVGALLTREDTESFVWLFQTWLSCMSDRHPNAIITDQCRAMQNAIKIVFPYTKHRWCLWHIMKKLPEKFKGKDYEAMKHWLKNAVYDSLSPAEFEENWAHLINKYELRDNDWLGGLYDERHRWVPAFVKDYFWAGMSTTQRSESMNAFFDGYVHSKTSLHEFVGQYENALRKKAEKEEEADAHSKNNVMLMVSPYGFEKQFHEALTLEKFMHFREQHAALTGCEFNKEELVNGIYQFSVEQDIELVDKNGEPFRKTMHFLVHFNEETKETNCNCRLFESKGMVCTHIIKVWTKRKLDKVPETYILVRWRKDVLRSHTKMRVSYVVSDRKPEWVRYDRLMLTFNDGADKVIYSETKTNRLNAEWKRIVQESEWWDDDEDCLDSRRTPIRVENVATVGDPRKGTKRGRPETKRKTSTFEKKSKKKANSNNKIQLCNKNAENIQASQGTNEENGMWRLDLDLNAEPCIH